VSGAERIYRMLLRAYPAALRAEYGREMLLAFRDARRDRRVSEPRFWIDIGWDVARAALPEVIMNAMAILAGLIGVMQAGNAVLETTAGGIAGRDALSIAVLAAIVVAGALLLCCGVALWRRRHGAAAMARRVAVICLALFAFIAIYRPMVSAFARLLGLAFPLALLLILAPRRRRHLAG
jgi:hypothetical protein